MSLSAKCHPNYHLLQAGRRLSGAQHLWLSVLAALAQPVQGIPLNHSSACALDDRRVKLQVFPEHRSCSEPFLACVSPRAIELRRFFEGRCDCGRGLSSLLQSWLSPCLFCGSLGSVAWNLQLFHRGLGVKRAEMVVVWQVIYFGETLVRNWAHRSLQDKVSLVFISASQNEPSYLVCSCVHVWIVMVWSIPLLCVMYFLLLLHIITYLTLLRCCLWYYVGLFFLSFDVGV